MYLNLITPGVGGFLSQHKDCFVRNSKFIFRQVVDEMILVPLYKDVGDMDAIFTLNEVGAFLWNRLERPITVAELMTDILDFFDVKPEEVAADLQEFLRAMEECGAIQRR